MLFDSKEERGKMQPTQVEEFARSKALTPVDGFARGFAALGGSLVKGITGVVTEPIRGASEKGAEGFFSGMGKGLLGVVFKPIGGVLEFGGKVGEGFANTPETLGLVRSSDNVLFGVPALEGFERCKETERRHVFLRIIDVIGEGQRAKPAEGLFVYGVAPRHVIEMATAYDTGLDPDLSADDPFLAVALLFRFLERLPEPVIPLPFHAPINALLTSQRGRITATSPVLKRLHTLLNQLPPVHKSILAELCIAIRKYLLYSGSGSVVLDHISLVLGRHLLRTGAPVDLIAADAAATAISPASSTDAVPGTDSTPVKKPDFPSPEVKQFTLLTTRTLIQFFCPGYLTYQLAKTDFVLEL